MITVIMPTLLMSDLTCFKQLINTLCNNKLIKEVIVVDNTLDGSFENKMGTFDKVVVIKNYKNIFVNPAWNIGVNWTMTKYYLILNDDIVITDEIINESYKAMEENDKISILTVETKENKSYEDLEVINNSKNEVKIKDLKNKRFGWFMMGRKSQWKNIPEGLNIYYGDDFIYKLGRRYNNINCMLCGMYISHFTSTTTGSDLFIDRKKIIKKEKKIYNKIKWNEY